MKKLMKTKPSGRRDFLRKSALGVASAGFLGAEILHGAGKKSQIQDNLHEVEEASVQEKKPRHLNLIYPETIKDKDGKDKKIRRIARIEAKDQDEVWWTAPKDTDIAIMFPPGRDPAQVGTTLVRAGLRSKVFTITALTETRESYFYSIYCYATSEFVEGANSEPELIVP